MEADFSQVSKAEKVPFNIWSQGQKRWQVCQAPPGIIPCECVETKAWVHQGTTGHLWLEPELLPPCQVLLRQRTTETEHLQGAGTGQARPPRRKATEKAQGSGRSGGRFACQWRAEASELQGKFSLGFSGSPVTFPEALYYLQQSVLITAFPVAPRVLTQLRRCAESAGSGLIDCGKFPRCNGETESK